MSQAPKTITEIEEKLKAELEKRDYTLKGMEDKIAYQSNKIVEQEGRIGELEKRIENVAEVVTRQLQKIQKG